MASRETENEQNVVPCTHHRDRDHGHCSRCGVPVFKDKYDESQVEWEDHVCPPGFLDLPPGPTSTQETDRG